MNEVMKGKKNAWYYGVVHIHHSSHIVFTSASSRHGAIKMTPMRSGRSFGCTGSSAESCRGASEEKEMM